MNKLEYKEGDYIEFVSVERMLPTIRNNFKNGDISRIKSATNYGINIVKNFDNVETIFSLGRNEFQYIKLWNPQDIHTSNQDLADKILKAAEDELFERTINESLDTRNEESFNKIVRGRLINDLQEI